MTTIILITAIAFCILLQVYYTLILFKKLIKTNDEINELTSLFNEHEKLPHFQTTKMFDKIYLNALEGKIKSINEINMNFSPLQMRRLAKAIEKNYPNGDPSEPPLSSQQHHQPVFLAADRS